MIHLGMHTCFECSTFCIFLASQRSKSGRKAKKVARLPESVNLKRMKDFSDHKAERNQSLKVLDSGRREE